MDEERPASAGRHSFLFAEVLQAENDPLKNDTQSLNVLATSVR